jgi:hypothetical protein
MELPLDERGSAGKRRATIAVTCRGCPISRRQALARKVRRACPRALNRRRPTAGSVSRAVKGGANISCRSLNLPPARGPFGKSDEGSNRLPNASFAAKSRRPKDAVVTALTARRWLQQETGVGFSKKYEACGRLFRFSQISYRPSLNDRRSSPKSASDAAICGGGMSPGMGTCGKGSR